jgi:hypothetical protein
MRSQWRRYTSWRIGYAWPQRHMGPSSVIIGAPHLQEASQMAFTQRDCPVKTLAPQGANQSLTKRICFRAPVRCFQHSELSLAIDVSSA